MARRLLWAVLISLVAGTGNAETLETVAEAKQIASEAMEQIANGNVTDGIRSLKPYFGIPDNELQTLIQTAERQLPSVKERFGKSLGYERLATERVGDSLMLLLYIQKFENHAIRWRFYFYKPQDGWLLNTLKYDDKIQKLFEHDA